LVFEAQTTDVAVKIEDPQCNQKNMGGGQGSVPWTLAPWTTTRTSTTDTSTTSTLTTTPCLWPCCMELRNFMGDVVEFMENRGHYSNHGGEVCTDTCQASSYADCPFTDVALPALPAPGPAGPPGPPGLASSPGECTRCSQGAYSIIWSLMVPILCSVLCSVCVSTLLLNRFPAAAGARMRGSPASEPLLMH
jgi:hypothetical protein